LPFILESALAIALFNSITFPPAVPQTARSGPNASDERAALRPEPRRLAFAAARSLLAGEREGNLSLRPESYSLTRLANGEVLELFYPVVGSRRGAKAAGYGLLYSSETAYREMHRPRHILEELIPDSQSFVSQIDPLISRLARRLRVKAGALDYSRASLKRIDAYLAGYQSRHTTAETDPALFQELTAYYGEALRRALGGEWKVRRESIAGSRTQEVPNLSMHGSTHGRELRPWSSVLNVLYNEDRRGLKLSALFDLDLASGGQS
jgi:hypothetical protein